MGIIGFLGVGKSTLIRHTSIKIIFNIRSKDMLNETIIQLLLKGL